MPLYQVIVLAIVQGFTEFLPVSSTAHLTLIPWLFGWKDPGLTFDIALHAGTLAAVLLYFFRDWIQIVGQAFGLPIGHDEELRRNPQLLWLLAAASIPIGIVGLLFNKQAEGAWRTPYVIGTMLIVIAGVLWYAERSARPTKDISRISPYDAGVIGIAQALAVIPGTSRSGITIAAGYFRGLDRQTAARFSFLLSTPAIAAAAAKGLYDLMKHGGIPLDMRTPFIVGIVISGITGCIAIALFLQFLRRFGLQFFIYYRVVLGIIVLSLAVFGHFET